MRERLLLCALAALPFGACNCDGQTSGGGGELVVVESALDFGAACLPPSSPDTLPEQPVRVLHLRNDGNAELYLNGFEVRPPTMAEVFAFDAAALPETVAAGEELEIPFTFGPKTAGRSQADLAIRGEDDSETIVKLTGTGSDLLPDPLMAMSCKGGAFPNIDACAAEPPVTPRMAFASTPVNSTAEMVVSLSNDGCPALSASKIVVTTTTPGAPASTFSLAQGQPDPLGVPSKAAPGEIRVRFSPNAINEFDGTLTFETNDPARPKVTINLTGSGSAPVLDVLTSVGCKTQSGSNARCCDFSPLTGFCTGFFTIKNAGDQELEFADATLKAGKALFSIKAKPAAGTRIPARSQLADAIEVEYHPGVDLDSDLMLVTSNGGNAQVELRGGSPPVLAASPGSTVDFGEVQNLTTSVTRRLELGNVSTYHEQLDLKVLSLDLTGRGFQLAESAAGLDCVVPFPSPATVKPGAVTGACLLFKPDPAGGLYEGTLRVRTNDPQHPDPGLALTLLAKAPCGANPEAIVTAPLGRDCSSCQAANETCLDSACHRTGSAGRSITVNPRSLVLSGEASYLPLFGPVGQDGKCPETGRDRTQIAQWDWRLISVPSNSTAASLDVAPGFSTAKTTTLTYDVTGLYTVRLLVKSASGAVSADTTFEVTITAQ